MLFTSPSFRPRSTSPLYFAAPPFQSQSALAGGCKHSVKYTVFLGYWEVYFSDQPQEAASLPTRRKLFCLLLFIYFINGIFHLNLYRKLYLLVSRDELSRWGQQYEWKSHCGIVLLFCSERFLFSPSFNQLLWKSVFVTVTCVLVPHCTIARTAASKEPFLSLGGCSCPDLLLQKVVGSTTPVRVAPLTKPPPPPLSPERQVMGEAGESSEGVRAAAAAAAAASCSALFYLFKSQECRSLKPWDLRAAARRWWCRDLKADPPCVSHRQRPLPPFPSTTPPPWPPPLPPSASGLPVHRSTQTHASVHFPFVLFCFYCVQRGWGA